MAAEIAFINEKTGKRYTVVSFDKEGGTVTLKGDQGVEFTENYDKELFRRLGYKLEQVAPAQAA